MITFILRSGRFVNSSEVCATLRWGKHFSYREVREAEVHLSSERHADIKHAAGDCAELFDYCEEVGSVPTTGDDHRLMRYLSECDQFEDQASVADELGLDLG